MTLDKPYYRIMRPYYSVMPSFEGDDYDYQEDEDNYDDDYYNYMLDNRYCSERSSLCRAYRIIQDDLEKLFDYIEPCNKNKKAYSHRTFELLLRGATEVEANCKGILKANGYTIIPPDRKMNITDYHKVEQATKLSEYEVRLKCWHPNPLVLKPFDNWRDTHSLSWYQAYNDAKHNRDTNFHKSCLLNTVTCIAGLFCLLYSQFEYQFVNPYQITTTNTKDKEGMMGFNGVIFTIKPPQTWTNSEKYKFNWESLSGSSSPYNQFRF
ncbi:MAG: hypothetical protein WCO49_07490 [Nostocales cyanobacterium ELA608]